MKVGQVFEAAIPIAIIAVGVSTATHRSKALGENVIIQSIGACSGAVVAGAIFTLPAIYILQAKYPEMTVSFLHMFLASALGGVLGILFLIPFRKYFVSDMHGKYPFPEATATTQVLVSGAKGGSQAKPLLIAGIVGGLYDFIVASFGWWNENFTSRFIGWGQVLADKAKLVFKVNTGAAVLGLGYIVGLKYALYICLGSLAVWWLIVPGMSLAFHDQVLNMWDPTITATVGNMSPEEIFKAYARSIGIGGIAMAGIIGIVKSWGIIKGAIGLAAKEMKGKGDATVAVKRTQRDISFKIIAIGSIAVIAITFLFFWLGVMHGNLLFAIVGILLVAIIAFLFTTVAANAIAIVGSNPVSGMTLMTLILASVVMVAVGLRGPGGMLAALVMGGVVCTALSMAGSHNAQQAGDLEVPRHPCQRRYGGGRDDRAQQDLRFCQWQARRTAGQRHGCRHRPADEWCRCSLDTLRHRSGHRHRPRPSSYSGSRRGSGHVHPIGTQRSARRGRSHQLVCHHSLEGCSREQGTWRERHAHRQRFHRRRRAHGRGERTDEVRRHRVLHCRHLVDQPAL